MNSRNSAAEVKFALRSDTRYLGFQYPSIPPPSTKSNDSKQINKTSKTKQNKKKEK